MKQSPLTYPHLRKRTNSFTRFLLVGIVNTLVGLSLIFLLMQFGLNYWVATFLGNGVGATVSYFLNRSFTFKSKVTPQKGVPTFILVILLCYFCSYSTSMWVISLLDAPSYLVSYLTQQDVAVLVGAFLYTLLNYTGQKYLVFSKLLS